MKMVGVLHTARATVPALSVMITKRYPEVQVCNWLDDSILPMLAGNSSTIEYIFEKMLYYSKAAEKQGANVIFNACSSVGEFKDYARGKLDIPVVRIDDAVTDLLVDKYGSIGVLATLETTLKPSADLIRRKNGKVALQMEVVQGAWDAGVTGDKKRQNALIAGAVERFLWQNEAVFLAQASMAEAADFLLPELRGRVYTSPEYGVESLGQFL